MVGVETMHALYHGEVSIGVHGELVADMDPLDHQNATLQFSLAFGVSPETTASGGDAARFQRAPECAGQSTGMCDRLVRKGLVRRHRQAGDRRTVRITLTPAGHELVAAVTKRRRAELARLLSVLPQDQHEPVIAAFQAFAEAAGEIPAPGAALGRGGP